MMVSMAKIYVTVEDTSQPLVKVQVYMYPAQRQQVRERAARRGMSMSEYLKFLVEQDSKE